MEYKTLTEAVERNKNHAKLRYGDRWQEVEKAYNEAMVKNPGSWKKDIREFMTTIEKDLGIVL